MHHLGPEVGQHLSFGMEIHERYTLSLKSSFHIKTMDGELYTKADDGKLGVGIAVV